jgi:hypothetical protein
MLAVKVQWGRIALLRLEFGLDSGLLFPHKMKLLVGLTSLNGASVKHRGITEERINYEIR